MILNLSKFDKLRTNKMAPDKRICDRLLILICLLGLITSGLLVEVESTDPLGQEDRELASSEAEAGSRLESDTSVGPQEESAKEEETSKEEFPGVENSGIEKLLGEASLAEETLADEGGVGGKDGEKKESSADEAETSTGRRSLEGESSHENNLKDEHPEWSEDESKFLIKQQNILDYRPGGGENVWERGASSDGSDKYSSDEGEPGSIDSPLRCAGADTCPMLSPGDPIRKLNPERDLSAAYKRVDKDLIERVRQKSNNLFKDVLDTLDDMYRDRQEASFLAQFSESGVRFDEIDEEIDVLEQLVRLRAVMLPNEYMCSLKSYIVLWNCDLLSGGKGHKLKIYDQEEARSKALWIIRFATKHHAERCRHAYADLFNHLLNVVDKTQLDRVKRALSKFIEPFVFPDKEPLEGSGKEYIYGPEPSEGKMLPLAGRLWVVFVNSGTVPTERRDWRRIYEGIKALAKEDAARTLDAGSSGTSSDYEIHVRFGELDPKDIKKHIVKYLMEPCAHYIDKMNRIFVPLEYDESMVKTNAFPLRDSTDTDFHYGWAHYRICEFLIKNKDVATANIKKLLERLVKRRKNAGTLI